MNLEEVRHFIYRNSLISHFQIVVKLIPNSKWPLEEQFRFHCKSHKREKASGVTQFVSHYAKGRRVCSSQTMRSLSASRPIPLPVVFSSPPHYTAEKAHRREPDGAFTAPSRLRG